MLSVSICDKDLQPVLANCQKLSMFTSKFRGLVSIWKPQDWLATSVRPRTNHFWHHLHSTQLQATFYFVCVERRRWFCFGLVSVFCGAICRVKRSHIIHNDKLVAAVNNFWALMSLLSCCGWCPSLAFSMTFWYTGWTWTVVFLSPPLKAPLTQNYHTSS